MIDTSLVVLAYAFIAFAAVVGTVAVAALVLAIRDLRRKPADSVPFTVGGRSEDFLGRAA
jgi:hypothetical protein